MGVMLYQIFTGVLPLAAADPCGGGVRCHIARQPLTLVDRREVPEALSGCLSERQSNGRIDLFRLGCLV
jgi:hypothetical protein